MDAHSLKRKRVEDRQLLINFACLKVLNNRRPNRLLGRIYRRNMENGIIPSFSAPLYGR